MIRRVLAAALFFLGFSFVSFSQSLVDLVGKPVGDESVTKFSTDNSLDSVTGLSYAKGVQLFQDEGVVAAIYLFNKGSVNGNDMAAYRGAMPFQISFGDSPETLKKKLGDTPVTQGDHLVWDLKTYRLEVAYADEKKTGIAYIVLEKK